VTTVHDSVPSSGASVRRRTVCRRDVDARDSPSSRPRGDAARDDVGTGRSRSVAHGLRRPDVRGSITRSGSRRQSAPTIYLKSAKTSITPAAQDHQLPRPGGARARMPRKARLSRRGGPGAGVRRRRPARSPRLFGLPVRDLPGPRGVVRRRSPSVWGMKLSAHRLHPVSRGTRTLKDAMNEALRNWVRPSRTRSTDRLARDRSDTWLVAICSAVVTSGARRRIRFLARPASCPTRWGRASAVARMQPGVRAPVHRASPELKGVRVEADGRGHRDRSSSGTMESGGSEYCKDH